MRGNGGARLAVGAALALAGGIACAGGHFDVDDAGTLDPVQCQYEAWWGRIGAEPVRVAHFGPACRMGPIEAAANFERNAVPGQSTYILGPQVKWTMLGDADSLWSAALSASLNFDVTQGGRAGGQFVLPLTWHPGPTSWLHANLGADWTPGTGARSRRLGVGGEWAMTEEISWLGERSRSFDAWTTRFGMRYTFTRLMSLDFTVARAGPQRVHGYVVGLNHEFGRP